jgi:nucleoside-diphosphate-sugar epimerase
MDYHRQFGVDIRIARIFNTYGPRMALDDGRVVPQFITQALRGEPLTIYGDGEQTRSFCYVDDLVTGLIALFELDTDHAPVNLGNPQPMTMNELATEILGLTESSSQITYLPLPLDDPMQREPDIRRAQDLLGWSPKVGRREGLTATIADIRARS